MSHGYVLGENAGPEILVSERFLWHCPRVSFINWSNYSIFGNGKEKHYAELMPKVNTVGSIVGIVLA